MPASMSARILECLEAFLQEHKRCGLLDAGVTDGVVWMACTSGARVAHPATRD